MGIFGRLIGGAGRAAADIASKYIDEDIAKSKAQFLADLQHNNMVRADQYMLGDERVGRAVAVEGKMIAARGDAETGVLTRRETDEGLQGAKRANRAAELGVETKAILDREQQSTPILVERERQVGGVKVGNAVSQAKQLMPIAIQQAAGEADARGRAQAKYREPKETLVGKVKEVEGILGRVLSAPEREALVGIKSSDGVEKLANQLTEASVKGAAEMGTPLKPQEVGKYRREVADALRSGGKPDEATAMRDAREAIAKGAPAESVNARLRGWGFSAIDIEAPAGKKADPTRKDPISGQPLTQSQWDRKYGRGDFQRLYQPGEDSLKAF